MSPRLAPKDRAEELLSQPVEEFISQRRTEGMTWTDVAFALREATGSEVAVSGEAVRQWHVAAANAA